MPTERPADLISLLAANLDRIRPFGARATHLVSVTSTNDVAGQLASDDAPEGTVIVADAQTAGRGRMGHTWYSPPVAGLYVSVILRPARAWLAAAPESVGTLTLMAGVALVDGLRAACGLAVALKWPNDIVVDRGQPGRGARRWRKIAGILAEGAAFGGELRHVVLGYGANLRRVSYPPEIAATASSIEEEIGRPVDRGTVLVETLAALSREYAALMAGDAAGVLARWRARSPSSEGAPVAWGDGANRVMGTTAGIDHTGALLVRTPAAGLERVRSGEVTWL